MSTRGPWLPRAAVLLLVTAGLSPAQERQPTRIVLHPPAGSARSIGQPLLPSLLVQTSEDALVYYRQAQEEMERVNKEVAQEELDAWLDMPLEKVDPKRLREQLASYARVFELADRGARCDRIEWDHREGLKKQGIRVELNGLQEMRQLARLMMLRARLALAEKDSEAFLATMRTGLALARHTAESPTLISSLVGMAIGLIMLNEMERAISQPDMPDLFWPLTTLPRPFIDLGKAFEGERLMCLGTFPGVLEAMQTRKGRAMTEEQCRECVELLVGGLELQKASTLKRFLLAGWIQSRHEKAREYLLEQGWKPEEVAVMPHLQATLLHLVLEYEEQLDEMTRLHRLPLPQALPLLQKAAAKSRSMVMEVNVVPPLARVFLPATQKVMRSRAQVQRRIDALRCIEAIRVHTAREGKLPASLDEITWAPLPREDPYTGRPWVYTVKDNVARLSCPTGPGLPEEADPPDYELLLPSR